MSSTWPARIRIARKLSPCPLRLARESPRGERQGPRILPAATARRPERGVRPGSARPRREPPPRGALARPGAGGKLDLAVTLDFRISSNALYSDMVLPTATWYEKDDLNTTDMHPFIHPFNAAVQPLWENPHRLGHLQDPRPRLLRSRRQAPRHTQGRGADTTAARHAERARTAARGARLEARGVRPRARQDRADDNSGGARLRRCLRPVRGTRAAGGEHRYRTKGVMEAAEDADLLAGLNGRVAEGSASGRPRLDTGARAAGPS